MSIKTDLESGLPIALVSGPACVVHIEPKFQHCQKKLSWSVQVVHLASLDDKARPIQVLQDKP
jgi:hypothetical protein